MQYQFAPQMAGAPVFQNADGEIDMEKVLELAPDLCLVTSKDLIEPLESNGLNAVHFERKQTDGVKAAITLMGEYLASRTWQRAASASRRTAGWKTSAPTPRRTF